MRSLPRGVVPCTALNDCTTCARCGDRAQRRGRQTRRQRPPLRFAPIGTGIAKQRTYALAGLSAHSVLLASDAHYQPPVAKLAVTNFLRPPLSNLRRQIRRFTGGYAMTRLTIHH